MEDMYDKTKLKMVFMSIKMAQSLKDHLGRVLQ